jgi:hypothetical protein
MCDSRGPRPLRKIATIVAIIAPALSVRLALVSATAPILAMAASA